MIADITKCYKILFIDKRFTTIGHECHCYHYKISLYLIIILCNIIGQNTPCFPVICLTTTQPPPSFKVFFSSFLFQAHTERSYPEWPYPNPASESRISSSYFQLLSQMRGGGVVWLPSNIREILYNV